jgi:MFS family permease
MFRDLHRDAKLIMASRGIRAFAFSYLNVVFAIYLDRLGYSTVTIGIIFTVAYLSGALLTAVWGYLSDRVGRRKILMLLAFLTIVSNGILVFFTGLFSILAAVIIANVGAGGSGGGGSGGGPFNPVEEALLAEKCRPENRNQIFAVNSCAGSIMGSAGALASGLPQFLQERGWSAVASYRPLFVLTILFSVVLLLVYRSMSEQHQPRAFQRKISKSTGTFVTKMSLLGVVDNFGAGMAGSLVAYWFFLRFGVELKSLGVIFFASYFLAALSFLSAPVIARHLGVVRTMAFSHGFASLMYLILPWVPTLALAASLLLIRSFFAYMDNPLRASFTMAMVASNERGSAAGVTNLARVIPFGISPTISTYLMQNISLTLPLFIGGGLQFMNDIAFYLMFRHVRPPEEQSSMRVRSARSAVSGNP